MAFKFLRRRIYQLRDELRRVRRFRKLPDRLATFEEAWERHLPAFLNAVSSVGAMGHELRRQRVESAESRTDADAKIKDLSARIAALHNQFNDFRIHRTNCVVNEVAPNIANAEKFRRSNAGEVKLHLGCVTGPLDGYMNVDTRKHLGVDIVASFDNLPFDPQSVAEIYSHQALERFTCERLRSGVLPYWRNLLRPRGTFRAVVLDTEAMAAALSAGEMSFEDFREAMLGAQENNDEFHYSLFSGESLSQILQQAGFTNIELVAAGRKNGKRIEIEISAKTD
jgi:hypothetical protein